MPKKVAKKITKKAGKKTTKRAPKVSSKKVTKQATTSRRSKAAPKVTTGVKETVTVTHSIYDIFAMEDVPFPPDDVQLFQSLSDRSNAFVTKEWGAYAWGYIQAANLLVDYVAQTGMDSDTLVLPITFQYRQYLELELKVLILLARSFLEIKGEIPKTHDLERLWNECRPLLDRVFTEQPKGHFDAQYNVVAKVIKQFAVVDPGSFGFRYPVDKEGNVAIPDDLQNINLGHMARTMGGIAVFLDHLESGVMYYMGYD